MMIDSVLDIIGKILMSRNKNADTQMSVGRSKNQIENVFLKMYMRNIFRKETKVQE